MLSLVDFVSNIVGVWPLIVVYLKETGRRDDSFNSVALSYTRSSCCFLLGQGNRWLFLYRSDGKKQFPPVPSESRDL